MAPITLAIVGDIHGGWTDADARWFEQAGYDRVIVVGDLAGFRWSGTLALAKRLGQMRAKTLVLPGNHDAVHALQLAAESSGRPRMGDRFAAGQRGMVDALREAIGEHELGAYSLHTVSGEGDEGGRDGDTVTLIAGRPHTMGGPGLSFAPHLEACWGVGTLEASAAKLKGLVDAAPTERVVFVSHNGPAGLGERRTDIWGCDFKREEGDWGDPDLREAVDYAQRVGKRVLAVAAGHMHRKLRGGGERVWQVERDGVLYVNAAEVPRLKKDGRRHHVRLVIDGDDVQVGDRYVS